MAQSPEELKRDIEQTRQDMSRDVDLISDKVSPGRIVQRRVDRTKDAVGSLRERVMGTASSGTTAVSDTAGSISDAVSGAPDAAMGRTQGNPMAAGLLAFAAGWLVAAIMPSSKVEQQAVMAVEDKVKEPVKERVTDIVNEMKDDLQGSAQEAVESVKESATDAVEAVKDQGAESAQNVRSETQDATGEVRSTTGGTA
jgi:gas vesicle protein